MYLEKLNEIGRITEADFAANNHNLTNEERVSLFNMYDRGFPSRDTVEYGQKSKRKWLIAEYETGDVILHSPWEVHTSCKSKDPGNIIRLATDLRVVETRKPFDER
jgi:phytanoyl-CoA hydroxylase